MLFDKGSSSNGCNSKNLMDVTLYDAASEPALNPSISLNSTKSQVGFGAFSEFTSCTDSFPQDWPTGPYNIRL